MQYKYKGVIFSKKNYCKSCFTCSKSVGSTWLIIKPIEGSLIARRISSIKSMVYTGSWCESYNVYF